jgi:His-Xaa-Ser system protein HxsD
MIIREVAFSTEGHSVDAIQRAAYRLSDRLSLELAVEHEAYRCKLHLDVQDDAGADVLLAGFRNEVLDQVLRERIRSETEEARNLILAAAFSGTGLIDHE